MKKLLVYLKNYKKETVLAPLFKLIEACFELVVPLVIVSIVDVGIKNGDNSYVFGRAGILVFLAFLGMVLAITAQYFAAKASAGFGKELRHSLFAKIQSLSFNELDTLGVSSLITRMTNDVNQVQSGVNMVLRLFMRSPVVVFGSVIMAFFIDARLALIFVVATVLLCAVVFGIMAYTVPKYKNTQNVLDGLTSKTRENLVGVRVIRAFTAEEDEKKEFAVQNNELSHMQRFVGRISGLMNPMAYVIINLAIVALIYKGSISVNVGNLTQGQVIALYNYMGQILIELIKFANLVVTVTKGFACASRVESVLICDSTLIHTNDDAIKSESAVEFKNVYLRYKNAGETSLDDINFAAKKGEVIGIVGGTGSGKSSLISMIAHFYDASDGCVLINGKNAQSYNDEELRSKIGYVQQKAVLFNGTVRENICWGKQNASDEEIILALQQAQVYEIISEKGGLDAVVEENGANFSGGQKQRLSIARALVRRPEILILDDSASALDYATESELRKSILSLDYRPTTFIVSQRASSVMEANQILVLDDGKIVGIGNHAELIETSPVYKDIFVSQFGKEGAYA